jgi:hypothetical protein
MLKVKWVTCGDDGHWCDLKRLNLDNIETKGVYIIWHEGNPGRVVRLGQGDIADRLGDHRRDNEILTYDKFGTLRVTWATVSAAQRDGVERYLADQWPPLVGDAFPDAEPIAVNSPW